MNEYCRYIYGGFLQLHEHDVPVILSVLNAVDELWLMDIFDYVEEYLLQDLDKLLTHFVQVQRFATQHHHFAKLHAFCVKTMEQDPSIMFEHEDFNLITQETLISLLKCNNLVMREIDLWNKVIEWGRAQDSCLSSIGVENWTNENFLTLGRLIQPCIRLINFTLINKNDFLEKVAPFKQIFDDGFYERILENYENQRLSNQQQKGIDSVLIDSKHVALICDWLTNDKHVSYQSYQNIPFELKAIYQCRALGPCFGGGISDLKLYLGFDESYGCRGNCLKNSYEKSIKKSKENQNANMFWVDEYEIFKIIKKVL